WAIAFAVGFGVLGWLIFPLGVSGNLSPVPLAALLIAGAVGCLLLWRPGTVLTMPSLNIMGWVLLALLGGVFVFDFLEALAPPADADTLAYHFFRPKQFLEAGRINFIPQVLEGAVPLGVQMTYVPALALGGEMALTLWTMLSGWAAAALLFVLSRRHLGLNWSLAVTLIYLTTPAVLYGGGNGQVEPRIALFVLVSAWAAVRALETGRLRYAVLAGLGCGFFAAAKYTGLLFAGATGVVLLFQRRWLAYGAVFGATLIAAGFQWYTWNGMHTGDPVFPMLFQWLGRDDLAFWNKAHDLIFKGAYFPAENPLSHSFLSFFLFPFKATLDFASVMDAGRVGFGPYGLLVLPFAALGFWRYRDRARRSPLLIYASLAFLFYVLWFFFGGSQRIRHLLPVLPLFLICVTVAAERFTAGKTHRGPLIASVMAVVILQMAVQGIFALNYFKFQIKGESRQAFLTRNVDAFPPVPWINANLKKSDRVLISFRQIQYYLNVPVFYASPLAQSTVELLPKKTSAQKLYRQLRSQGVTHMLLTPRSGKTGKSYPLPYEPLYQTGCLEMLRHFEGNAIGSRTLPTMNSNPLPLDVLRLKGEGCIR
ncbi:MAG: glycosyltransferase family 39 protein, partial [Proteobacteria bacterium]|nr:glycosyltransferase family 39 protein [Pseudomonadota bacterium]